MSSIKSVAIAGASGNLGTIVLQALVSEGFAVTALVRANDKEVYDSNVKVVEVDYASMESLTSALKGIDGVVSTVSHAAASSQGTLIDAATAVGVKRFIPSDYTSCTYSPEITSLPVYAPSFKIRQHLQESAKAGNLTWTVLQCGGFLEYILGGPIVLDFVHHKAILYDGGDNRMSSTSMLSIGKAIIGIFKNPEATKNKVVRTSEIIFTQNELLKIAEDLKPEIKWETSSLSTDVVVQEGLDELKSGGFSMPSYMKILTGTVMAGEKYGAVNDETDNELLGVESMTKEELKKRVAGKLV